MKPLLKSALAATTLTLALAPMAPADDNFSIFGIPDHDQRRQALPGKGGMYCAPTSAWNMLDFMRTHGVTSLKYHPLDPTGTILAAQPYSSHDQRLALMGAFMNTDPTDGTYSNGVHNGLLSYLNMCGVPAMVMSYAKDDNFPSPQVALSWMRLGGLVEFCYGRYTNPYGFDKQRDGGHCLTMNGVQRKDTAFPNPFDIPYLPDFIYNFHCTYRDPAQDEGSADPNRLKKQSPWKNKSFDFHMEHANFDGTETSLYGIGNKPTVDNDPNPLNWRYAYLDGYQIVMPFMVLTNVLNSDNLQVKFAMTFNNTKQTYFPNLISTIPLGSKVTSAGDMTFDPILPSFVRTQRGSGDIVQGELAERTGRVLATAPEPIKGLTYGGENMDLFALGDKRVYKLGRSRKWVGQVDLPEVPEAFAFDNTRNLLLVASGIKLRMYDANLNLRSVGELPDMRGTGRMTLRTDPTSGDLFVMRAGDGSVRRFRRSGANYALIGLLNLTRAANPLSFDFDHIGNLIVSDDGIAKTFNRRGELVNGRWDNQPLGNLVRTMRNFNNMTPVRCPFPAWRNLEDPLDPLGDTGG
jgi:hypothetical protein